MTETDLLAPFDLAVIRTTAQHNKIEEARLREALTTHQRTMRETPGVENLVYEWRKQYDDPVLARTPTMFVLAVPPTVWEEYAEYLDFEDATLAAVTAVHQEQTLRAESVDLSGMPEDHVAIIVSRE